MDAKDKTNRTETFGDRLRVIRELLGLTQQTFAERLGYKSNSQIAAIERNKTFPRVPALQKLSELTPVDFNWLITGQESFGAKNSNTGPLRLRDATREEIDQELARRQLIIDALAGRIESQVQYGIDCSLDFGELVKAVDYQISQTLPKDAPAWLRKALGY